MKNLLFISLLIFAFNLNLYSKNEYKISSPDGKLNCRIQADRVITMTVDLDGKIIIEPSVLKMSVDGKSITDGIKSGKGKESQINEMFPLKGLHSTGKNQCTVLAIPVTVK